MAQNALANQIVLISKDNKPTIAFQESTQQFYDSKGNVRVQIGMTVKGISTLLLKMETEPLYLMKMVLPRQVFQIIQFLET